MFDESIEWYERRLTMDGFVQEKYYGSLRLGFLYEQKGRTMDAIRVWLAAISYDPDRIEGLIYAMFTLMNQG